VRGGPSSRPVTLEESPDPSWADLIALSNHWCPYDQAVNGLISTWGGLRDKCIQLNWIHARTDLYLTRHGLRSRPRDSRPRPRRASTPPATRAREARARCGRPAAAATRGRATPTNCATSVRAGTPRRTAADGPRAARASGRPGASRERASTHVPAGSIAGGAQTKEGSSRSQV